MLIQQILPACIVLVCWLSSARGHHMDFVKDDEEATNRTKEWTVKENKRIAKPHLDLYVQDNEIRLMIEVFQTPLDVTINILMNNVTIDLTRYENNTCYNIHGKCSSTICSCIVENNIFTSTYHLTLRKKYMTLGLEYRFIHEIDGSIVKVCLFKTFDGANFSRPYTKFVTLHSFAAERNELSIPSTNINENKKELGNPTYILVCVISFICFTICINYHVFPSEPNCKTGDIHEKQIKNEEPLNCSTNCHKRSERTNLLNRSLSEQLILPVKDSSSEDDARDIDSEHVHSHFNKDTTRVDGFSIKTNIDFESCERRANALDRAHSEQLMLPGKYSSSEDDAMDIRANALERAHSEQLMLPERDSFSEDDARDIESFHYNKLSSFEKDTTTSPDNSINTKIEYESCERGTNVPDRSPSEQLMLPKTDSSAEDDARNIENVHSDKLSNFNKHTTTVPDISFNTNIDFESYERLRNAQETSSLYQLWLHGKQSGADSQENIIIENGTGKRLRNAQETSSLNQLGLHKKQSGADSKENIIIENRTGKMLRNTQEKSFPHQLWLHEILSGADSTENIIIDHGAWKRLRNAQEKSSPHQLWLHGKSSGADSTENIIIDHGAGKRLRNAQEKSSPHQFWLHGKSSEADIAENIIMEYEAGKRENPPKTQKVDNDKEVKKKRKTGSSALSLLNIDDNSITGSDMTDLYVPYYMDSALSAKKSIIRNTESENIDEFGEITADNFAAVPIPAENTIFGIDLYKIGQILSRFPVIGVVISGAVGGMIDNFTRRTPD